MFNFLLGSRSPKWRTVRKIHLIDNPTCEACNTKKKLQVHHVRPVSIAPELELRFANLITLCKKNKCHRMVGHLGSWRSFNKDVREDAKKLRYKIINRP